MNCPKCRLFNPPSAERCDCGYDFRTGKVEQSYDPSVLHPDVVRELGQRDVRVGAVLCIVGLAITLGTYGLASSVGGGPYIIASGAIVWGAIKCARGVDRVRTGVNRAFWGNK
jgi:hypothetical protein